MQTVSGLTVIILSFLALSVESHALDRDKPIEGVAGEVVSVHGVVYVRQDVARGQAPASIQIKPGQNVFQADVINTGSDGAIKILLKDKSIIDLGPSSSFKIADFKVKDGANREVNLDMAFGRLRVAVTKKLKGDGKFNVKTKAATMGVRGTEFVVKSDLGFAGKGANAPKTDVTVLQGKVDVASAPTTSGAPSAPIQSLTAGGRISTTLGSAPAPVIQLNNSQMQSVASIGKVADNTFAKAVTLEQQPDENSSSSRSPASNDGTNSSSSSKPADAPAGSLQAAVANLAVQAPTVPVSFSEIGVPGAPSVTTATNSAVNQVNRSYRVTVIVGQ
ncbi:MAG: FecR domain-containing protein [Bdellovibrionales bacterium]|nr:FecR domain-containing protein [Bdellovibrionales bacterium]